MQVCQHTLSSYRLYVSARVIKFYFSRKTCFVPVAKPFHSLKLRWSAAISVNGGANFGQVNLNRFF